jgi:hypothetical protein
MKYTDFIFGMLGLTIGLVFLYASGNFTEDWWRMHFPIHHGLIGLVGIAVGWAFKKNWLIAFSIGLVASDIMDFPWVGVE